MLELLQAHPLLRVADLAERLGVDERTVRRYAGHLADLGVPVVSERGRYGGYRLMPGYRLPPLMLTDDEAAAVVLGLLAGRRIGLTAEATESALAKVSRVLPEPLRARVRALTRALEFTGPAREGAAPATEAVLTLASAARERRRVRLAHRSARGRLTEREVDPYGLVFHSGRWYVTGLDHASGEHRTFRVDRVTEVVATAARFEPPDGVDTVARVTAALAAAPWRHEVEVLLRTDPATARARVPAWLATLTETEDGVLLRARAENLDGMARVLAGLGVPFRVLRPDALRHAVRDLADQLADSAGEAG